MAWVKVSERLPEPGERVLVYEPGPGEILDVGGLCGGGWVPERWWYGDGLECSPTHWMPLPAPPRGGE